MRTTLDIDDDVLQAAKERAGREGSTAGKVIHSGGSPSPPAGSGVREPKPLYGFRPLAPRGGVVTNELIDKLREDDAY